MVRKPPFTPYQFIDRTQPNQRKGGFVYYTASLKDLIQNHIDGSDNSPFSNVIIGGTRSFDEDDNRLLLESVVFGTSGYVSLKMADNFQALFYVRTENNDYFEDNAQNAISSDWSDTTDAREMLADEGFPSVWFKMTPSSRIRGRFSVLTRGIMYQLTLMENRDPLLECDRDWETMI